MNTASKTSVIMACLLMSATVSTAADTRDRLTVQDLFLSNHSQVVANRYFQPIGREEPPAHRLSGTLHFSETRMSTSHPDSDWKGSGQTYFPSFSLPVISHEGHLVPLERGIILSGEKNISFYNIIVSPGRIWTEVGDGGYTRASLPFTLTDNRVGQARNGIATFVFNAVEISPAAIQITQETSPGVDYVQTDFSASIAVSYERSDFTDRERHIQEFRKEQEMRLPVRPWSDLPEGDISQSLFNLLLAPSDISAAALVVDSVLYVQTIETRSAGAFPFPQSMRHGVFSVTKTLGMGLSMFYVAQRYGEQVFDSLITDYVPELADHPGWSGVTFEHALNMLTGTDAVDSGPRMVPFLRARTAADKLTAILEFSDAPPRPGERFLYASINTFVLSHALNQYVKAREGPGADFWLMLKEDVLAPMGIPHLPVSRTIEPDGSLGTPLMGFGAYPTIGEAAKIAKLLNDEGEFQGQQLLHRRKVREALYRSLHPGHDAGGGRRYLHSVWMNLVETDACQLEVPYMSGLGGNVVAFLPSGLIVIRFTDADDYVLRPLVNAAERHRSSCR